jgi:hypothetical protein
MIEANSMEQAWEKLDERLKQRKQRNCALDYEFGYFI